MQKIYDFIAQRPSGELVRLSQFAGKVLLIVNTASKCGFTPQFAGLEELYQRYRDRGLVILGFPCGQFLGQELSTGEDAASFCSLNYGVSFPDDEEGTRQWPLRRPYLHLPQARCTWYAHLVH